MRNSWRRSSKSVCIAFATGCPRNQMDTAWLFPYFQANGWTIVERPETADLVIASACGFDAAAEEESIRRLGALKKNLNGTPLIVTGCLAGINAARVSEQLDATPIRPADIDELDRIIAATVPLSGVPPINETSPVLQRALAYCRYRDRYPDADMRAVLRDMARRIVGRSLRRLHVEPPARRLIRALKRIRGRESQFQIRVARGCLEECSYCAIRMAAGTLRSKPLAAVLAEFDRGLAQGYRLFELVGEDLGPYGKDIDTTLPNLLTQLFQRQRRFKLIFTDINIRYVIEYAADLTTLLATHARRIERLRVPIQSGSDRVLAAMQRCYRVADVMRCLQRLQDAAPSLPLETHVLVGFPGETEADFRATVDLLKAVKFVRIQVYTYTDRIGTAASEMGQKVPGSVKRDRVNHLLREFDQAASCALNPRKQTAFDYDLSPQPPVVSVGTEPYPAADESVRSPGVQDTVAKPHRPTLEIKDLAPPHDGPGKPVQI